MMYLTLANLLRLSSARPSQAGARPAPSPLPALRPRAASLTALALLCSAAAHAAPDAAVRPAMAGMAPHAAASATAPRKPAAPVKLVDINSASAKELKTLPGIGDAEAEKIIANRPYLTKAELVTKKVLPTGPYLSLKNRVVAMQKGRPKAAKP